MKRKPYHTDMTDKQRDIIETLLPSAEQTGRPRELSLREIVNAVFYIVRGGCSRRLLPRDFPGWSSVYYYFRKWKLNGTWEYVHNALSGETRIHEGRDPEPAVGIIDTQSVRITDRGGEHGFDGWKKVNGRKRHILTDVTGLLITAAVHSAGIQDRDGAELLFPGIYGRFSRLKLILTDGIYTGDIIRRVKEKFGMVMETVKRPKGAGGFTLIPRRRVVERTFAWLNRHRRLSKDYEYLTDTAEAVVYIAMIGIMLHRLAPEK